MRHTYLILAGSILGACGDNVSVQQISGRLDQSTFPQPMDTVRLFSSHGIYSETPIGSAGELLIYAPAGDRYRVVFAVTGLSRSKLVFPRTTGTVDNTFRIHRSMGAIDLGQVRYVGDPAATPFVFTCTDDTDPNGMCVDDAGSGQGGHMDGDNQQCGDNQDGENNDGESGDNGEMDGETADDMESDDAALANDAAVPHTNLEGDVGCHGDEGDHQDEGNDGEGDGGHQDLTPAPRLAIPTQLFE